MGRATRPGARATFIYDNVGNTPQKWHQGSQPLTMSYDAAQRLVTAVDGPTPVTYTFDNNGNMTLENRNGAQTQSVYDRSNRLKAEVTTSVTAGRRCSTTATG